MFSSRPKSTHDVLKDPQLSSEPAITYDDLKDDIIPTSSSDLTSKYNDFAFILHFNFI